MISPLILMEGTPPSLASLFKKLSFKGLQNGSLDACNLLCMFGKMGHSQI